MDVVEGLERAFDRTGQVIDHVDPSDLTAATPCDEWDLAELLGHVVGTAAAFASVLNGGAVPARARIPPTDATSARYRHEAAACLSGWRRPGALEQDYENVIELDGGVLIPPIPLPGDMLAAINLLDAGVHLHDLARTIGRADLAADDGLADATLTAARAILAPGIRELVGFGPERPAPADADTVGRLLAFVGREPATNA